MTDPNLRKEEADEHVLHLPEPFSFAVKSDYDYLRDRWDKRFVSFLLRVIAILVLVPFNFVALGFRVYGRKNLKVLKKRGAVTICNHIHPLDCTMIYLALWNRRGYFVTLDTNFKIPIARHLIRGFGGVPISKNPHQIKQLFTVMGGALTRGNYVQIYPEGVLYPYCHTLRKFHPGAFRLAADNGVPVLPMILTLERPHGLFTWYKRRRCLRLHILPPVEPDLTLEKRECTAKLQQDCLKAMNQKRIERRRAQRLTKT
ncbi:MAG TPA: lysophospholipid acyltransferase family protein [Oscillospiraceae bacterium]|nr:lysophospholipid acyltransferase family protein [Oscillospiraceae bacterium]HPF56582.1 lysophospholipid acyltransferase family protein [Clostridiales bacterium]HPK36290.1 lysophospholipid acyltransferase family protein [Oscillospiraceae bacterium]HPR75022.1 lysophospholipid acyltransferase family protein [Oscillospiraceae bacterium]